MRIVRETGKPVAQVARDLGIHEGTLGNWVNKPPAAYEQLLSERAANKARQELAAWGREREHRDLGTRVSET